MVTNDYCIKVYISYLVHTTNENNIQTAKIAMSKLSIMMSFNCSNSCKVAFNHLSILISILPDKVLMCEIVVKYQYSVILCQSFSRNDQGEGLQELVCLYSNKYGVYKE